MFSRNLILLMRNVCLVRPFRINKINPNFFDLKYVSTHPSVDKKSIPNSPSLAVHEISKFDRNIFIKLVENVPQPASSSKPTYSITKDYCDILMDGENLKPQEKQETPSKTQTEPPPPSTMESMQQAKQQPSLELQSEPQTQSTLEQPEFQPELEPIAKAEAQAKQQTQSNSAQHELQPRSTIKPKPQFKYETDPQPQTQSTVQPKHVAGMRAKPKSIAPRQPPIAPEMKPQEKEQFLSKSQEDEFIPKPEMHEHLQTELKSHVQPEPQPQLKSEPETQAIQQSLLKSQLQSAAPNLEQIPSIPQSPDLPKSSLKLESQLEQDIKSKKFELKPEPDAIEEPNLPTTQKSQPPTKQESEPQPQSIVEPMPKEKNDTESPIPQPQVQPKITVGPHSQKVFQIQSEPKPKSEKTHKLTVVQLMGVVIGILVAIMAAIVFITRDVV